MWWRHRLLWRRNGSLAAIFKVFSIYCTVETLYVHTKPRKYPGQLLCLTTRIIIVYSECLGVIITRLGFFLLLRRQIKLSFNWLIKYFAPDLSASVPCVFIVRYSLCTVRLTAQVSSFSCLNSAWKSSGFTKPSHQFYVLRESSTWNNFRLKQSLISE